MTSLTDHQKQLLFDYCIGLASEKDSAKAKTLISTNQEAAETYTRLKASLSPLEMLEAESDPCPDDLVESTVWRLCNVARSSQLQLQRLLAAEQTRYSAPEPGIWRNLAQRLATAAVFMIVGSIVITMFNITTNIARQKYWQQMCQTQLSNIWQGMKNYTADHNGKLPTVATTTGAPWWKIGYPGKENHSNTRNVWLLVKNNYINPADCVCPGKKRLQRMNFDNLQIQELNDFPNRNYMTYSFRITCTPDEKESSLGRRPLISDLNPLFEKLPRNYSKSFRLKLNKQLITFNSINHNRRGQNILFCDGSVEFVQKRQIGIANDDIFTLQNTKIYEGVEVPSCTTDAFLAP